MKRTITAIALVISSFAGFAHADRTTQVNLRASETTFPIISAAPRMGETEEQLAHDVVYTREGLITALGTLYDAGSQLRERGQANPAERVREEMRKTITTDAWAKPLNAAERDAVVGAMVHVTVGGYEGK